MLLVFLFDFLPDLVSLFHPLLEEFDQPFLHTKLLLEANWVGSNDTLECHFINDVLDKGNLLLIGFVAQVKLVAIRATSLFRYFNRLILWKFFELI